MIRQAGRERALTVQSLGSGSSGNALLLDSGDALLLIDCGLTPRALEKSVQQAGHRLTDISAVLLTHEHGDHARALPRLLRAGIRVIATPGTTAAVAPGSRLTDLIDIGSSREVSGMVVTALPLCHDAAEPCGFFVEWAGSRVAVITDLGCEEDVLLGPLSRADLVVVEANHDAAMLRRGPYPIHLKRRVLSRSGHLSNDQCGDMLAAAFARESRPRTVWLAHLSATNNRPELARRTVAGALSRQNVAHPIVPLPRHGLGPAWRAGEQEYPSDPIQLSMPFL